MQEGTLGEVKVERARTTRLKEGRIQSFLSGLARGQVIREADLERALLVLTDQPGVVVRSVLRPGKAPGTADLVVQVRENAAVHAQAGYDNTGSRYTGRNRFLVDVGLNDWFGVGEAFSLRAITSFQDMTAYTLSGSVPVGGSGLRAGLTHTRVSYRLGREFIPLGASGDAEATGSGNVAITGTASGAANGVSIGTGGTNNIATTSGNITINGTGAGDGTGISMTSGANAITTGGGNITIDARALGDGDGLAMSSGTNTVATGGAGNLTINGNAPLGNAVSLGTASKTAGTSTLRVADGVLTVNATAAGSTSALSFGVISGGDPATNTIEATLGGDIIINAVNTGSASGMSMGSSSNNTIRSGAGSIEVNATAAQAAGLAMASGNNAILSGAGGIVLNGTSQGAGNGVSMGTGTNLVAAGGSGNITVNGTAQGATGFGLSMATSGNNTLRVADGILTVRGQSAGEGSAVIMGSGSSTIEATGSGSIDIAGHAAGTGNGFSMGTSGTNTVRTVSGRLDITGKGGDHGINLGSGTNTIQSDSGAVNLAGTALSSGHGFYISSTGRDSVLTNSGDITISGSSATGGAIVIRPTEQQAIIEATGAGNISFRADNYDATPSGTGSARIASAGGVLSIAQLTKGTSIGIGEGAAGLLNWSGAEISQVSGFSLVRVGNSESGALDLRPPWFPFPMQLPPATLSQDELKFNTVRGAAERILSEIMSYGELPPTLAVTRRFSLLIQGFNR